MIGREFFDAVAAHDSLEWMDVREPASGEDEVVVCHTETDVKHAITVKSILDHTWKELEEVLTGKREAHVMIHLTRIVGYYSRVQNWNRSKLAELNDRHTGSYGLPERKAPAAIVAKVA